MNDENNDVPEYFSMEANLKEVCQRLDSPPVEPLIDFG